MSTKLSQYQISCVIRVCRLIYRIDWVLIFSVCSSNQLSKIRTKHCIVFQLCFVQFFKITFKIQNILKHHDSNTIWCFEEILIKFCDLVIDVWSHWTIILYLFYKQLTFFLSTLLSTYVCLPRPTHHNLFPFFIFSDSKVVERQEPSVICQSGSGSELGKQVRVRSPGFNGEKLR